MWQRKLYQAMAFLNSYGNETLKCEGTTLKVDLWLNVWTSGAYTLGYFQSKML
jgi:hypothetical protein